MMQAGKSMWGEFSNIKPFITELCFTSAMVMPPHTGASSLKRGHKLDLSTVNCALVLKGGHKMDFSTVIYALVSKGGHKMTVLKSNLCPASVFQDNHCKIENLTIFMT